MAGPEPGGLPLPGDFRAVAEHYGTGTVDDLLRLYGGADLAAWIEGQLEVERDAQDIFLDP